VLSREELKKLERKAKSFMLTKEIPQGKVEVVRSIMSNSKLLEEERYRAIIELLTNCSDKPRQEIRPRKIDIQDNEKKLNRRTVVIPKSDSYLTGGPVIGSEHINSLYSEFKPLGLFKKRYLAAANNRFGITFKKRLIPVKKFFRLAEDIRTSQDRIMSRLPSIMNMILEDQMIDDPLYFNYLRVFSTWMMEAPFMSLSADRAKWFDQRNFEREIRNWAIQYIAFRETDTSTKEGIILVIETKLRDMDDLRKEQVLPFDNDSERSSKDKRNLEREKTIYDYMMTLRSFLPSVDPSDGLVCKQISSRYNILSLEEFIAIVFSALIFKRRITMRDILRYYDVKQIRVSPTEWDYGKEALRQYGKDLESKKKRYIGKLREILTEFDEIYDLVNMRYDTVDFVKKAFDDQWKIMNRRRHDGSDVYEKNFFSYIDDCMTHFITVYARFIDGSALVLEDEDSKKYESSIFSRGYFESEIMSLLNLQSDIIQFKSSNPNYIISRVEAKRIMMGQMSSMFDLESFIRQIGVVFYEIGRSLRKIISSHYIWRRTSTSVPPARLVRSPLEKLDSISMEAEVALPVPFYDCRLGMSENFNAIQKMLVGRPILSDSVKDGLVNSITAFCLQFAHECFNRTIFNDLDYRKELIRKIEEAERS
jgi:hypothetical protein